MCTVMRSLEPSCVSLNFEEPIAIDRWRGHFSSGLVASYVLHIVVTQGPNDRQNCLVRPVNLTTTEKREKERKPEVVNTLKYIFLSKRLQAGRGKP